MYSQQHGWFPLNMRKHFWVAQVTEQWYRFPREAVESPPWGHNGLGSGLWVFWWSSGWRIDHIFPIARNHTWNEGKAKDYSTGHSHPPLCLTPAFKINETKFCFLQFGSLRHSSFYFTLLFVWRTDIWTCLISVYTQLASWKFRSYDTALAISRDWGMRGWRKTHPDGIRRTWRHQLDCSGKGHLLHRCNFGTKTSEIVISIVVTIKLERVRARGQDVET